MEGWDLVTRRIVLVAMVCLMLDGCALNPEVWTSVDENSALIFGFYDMSEAPYELGCVRITQDERAGIAYRQSCMTTLSSGLFFLDNAPPMKYPSHFSMPAGGFT